MFDAPYKYCNIGSHPYYDGLRKKKIVYKFKSLHRQYLVTLEEYTCGIVAIKYCTRHDYKARNPYCRLVNNKEDNDAIRIITTCLFIMLEYWSKNLAVSFSFIGVLREQVDPAIIKRRNLYGEKLEHYRKSRFLIYKYAMYVLFDPVYFEHSLDSVNAIYLLINVREPNKARIKEEVVALLSHQYCSFFDPL